MLSALPTHRVVVDQVIVHDEGYRFRFFRFRHRVGVITIHFANDILSTRFTPKALFA
jgi:hypothetical protein